MLLNLFLKLLTSSDLVIKTHLLTIYSHRLNYLKNKEILKEPLILILILKEKIPQIFKYVKKLGKGLYIYQLTTTRKDVEM